MVLKDVGIPSEWQVGRHDQVGPWVLSGAGWGGGVGKGSSTCTAIMYAYIMKSAATIMT